MTSQDARATAPAAIEILRRIGWRLLFRENRLARKRTRLSLARNGIDNRDQLTSEITAAEDEIAHCRELLDEVVGWISKRTGLAERLLRSVATCEEAFERPEFLEAFAKMNYLDLSQATQQIWIAICETEPDLAAVIGGRQVIATVQARKTAAKSAQKTSRSQADATLRKLVGSDPSIKHLSAEVLANMVKKELGQSCSASTVAKTQFWEEIANETGRRRTRNGKKHTKKAFIEQRDSKSGFTALAEMVAQETVEEERKAIYRINNSGLGETEKAEMIEKLLAGTMTPESAISIAGMYSKRAKSVEPVPIRDLAGVSNTI